MSALRGKSAAARGARPLRLVRVEEDYRSDPFDAKPPTPVYLTVEHGDPLPIVAVDASMQPMARFRSPGSAAAFLNAVRPSVHTLPQRILDQLNELI